MQERNLELFLRDYLMECIYWPELSKNDQVIEIDGKEAKHLKVLNTKSGAKILITNGNGLCAEARAERIAKERYKADVIEFRENLGELPYRLGVAMGILDKRDRLEFALEKSIELGISDFYPLITKYTQKNKIQDERLFLKAIAAIKQCKRAKLPTIHAPIDVKNIDETAAEYDKIILLDENGSRPCFNDKQENILIVCGPEGGFDYSEIEMIKGLPNTSLTALGNRRLRAETAAISAVVLNSF